jgi:hypothetical protein
MKIYSNLDSEFKLLDYQITHSQVLFRSMKSKERDYNIDIIFKPVINMLITDSFNGMEISLFELVNKNNSILKDYSFKINKDYRIFTLRDINNNTYYVNAMCFAIYHNKLDILETSIERFGTEESRGECILWYNK